MKLFVTRHGQSEYNIKELTCGISDAKLTALGIEQARELAEKLKAEQEENQIRHIFVSPLSRARITASCVEEALDLKAEVDERLKECNFGIFEGQYYKDPDFNKLLFSPFARFEGGESAVDVACRVYPFLKELKERVHDENTLLVCHGFLARVLSSYFNSYSSVEEYRAVKWGNCEVKVFEL